MVASQLANTLKTKHQALRMPKTTNNILRMTAKIIKTAKRTCRGKRESTLLKTVPFTAVSGLAGTVTATVTKPGLMVLGMKASG